MADFILPPGFVPASAAPPAPAPAPESVVPPVDTPPAPTDTGQTPPAPIEPSTPAVPDTNPFEVASNGRVKSAEELAALIQEREMLQQKALDLEAKVAQDPFGGNALAKKFAELAGQGAKVEELANFVQLQTLDVAKMEPLDAIRLSIKTSNPGWDAAMVDAYMADTLKLSAYIDGDGKDASPLDRVMLSNATKEAQANLEKFKVQSETPSSVAEVQRQQQLMAAREQSVSTVLQSVAGSLKTIKVGEGDSAFDFQVDQSVLNMAIPNMVKQFAAGGQPVNESMAGAAAQQLKALVFATQGEKIVQAAIKNTESRTREKVVLEMSNGQVPGNTSNPKPAPKQDAGPWPDPSQLILRSGKKI